MLFSKCRGSSAWESTRLKTGLSRVQITPPALIHVVVYHSRYLGLIVNCGWVESKFWSYSNSIPRKGMVWLSVPDPGQPPPEHIFQKIRIGDWLIPFWAGILSSLVPSDCCAEINTEFLTWSYILAKISVCVNSRWISGITVTNVKQTSSQALCS